MCTRTDFLNMCLQAAAEEIVIQIFFNIDSCESFWCFGPSFLFHSQIYVYSNIQECHTLVRTGLPNKYLQTLQASDVIQLQKKFVISLLSSWWKTSQKCCCYCLWCWCRQWRVLWKGKTRTGIPAPTGVIRFYFAGPTHICQSSTYLKLKCFSPSLQWDNT